MRYFCKKMYETNGKNIYEQFNLHYRLLSKLFSIELLSFILEIIEYINRIFIHMNTTLTKRTPLV